MQNNSSSFSNGLGTSVLIYSFDFNIGNLGMVPTRYYFLKQRQSLSVELDKTKTAYISPPYQTAVLANLVAKRNNNI